MPRVVISPLTLPSGISRLDLMLGGGIRTGNITHVYGRAGSGKTTLALEFVLSALRMGHHVVYVNSETSSPIERLEQMAGRPYQDILNSIRIIVPKNFKEQGEIVEDLELYAPERTRIIVVDTLTRLYRVSLDDKATNYTAHRELNRQAGLLKGIASQRNVAVMILNQVRAKLDGTDDFEPVARNIMEYWSDVTLKLTAGKSSSERIVERIDFPSEKARLRLWIRNSGFVLHENIQQE
ncbi:hypothetical protein EU545_02495 [Candidatus Thorarchaeota archaeon]|nr:MAG: hypothetical protein EU545_02495 [Candidatus Thorarchaeota archaeon]